MGRPGAAVTVGMVSELVREDEQRTEWLVGGWRCVSGGVTLCWGVSDSVWVALELQGWYGMWSCEHLFLGHWVWWRGRAYWALLMTVGFF